MNDKKPEIEFPCYFPLKAIGKEPETYEQYVIDTINDHVDDLDESLVTTRPSNGGKYIAVTIPFTARSREQLDAIYAALSVDPRTMVLL